MSQVDDLATWTTKNTKPIERKFYQPEVEENIHHQSETIVKDDHKNDPRKK